MNSNLSPQWLLTGGVVENLSFRTAASLVEGHHRHQVCVATCAVVGAAPAGGVAALLCTVSSLDEGCVAVDVSHRVPGQRAASFCRLHNSQRLWGAGD